MATRVSLSCSTILATLLLLLFLATPSCAIPVTTRVGETCAQNSDCIDGEYCAADLTCTLVPYSPLLTTNGNAASSGTSAFSLIMVTDVQFYFKICKREPLTECIFNGLTRGTVSGKNDLLVEAAQHQVDCISTLSSSLSDVKAVFDNGDLVNKGLAREVRHLQTYFHDKISLPLIVGLGNHDYGVNNYSLRYSVEGRRDMVNYLADKITDLSAVLEIRNIDFERTTTLTGASGIEEVYTTGSLCYSVEFNDYVFIMLHWSTALKVGPYTADFQADETDSSGSVTKTEYFKITNPETWLKTELDDIKASGKKAILVPHSFKGLDVFTDKVQDFTDFLYNSEVIAILSGHVHDAWGYDQDMVVGSTNTRNIPVYYAGSASYEKLIAISMAANKGGLSVQAYTTTDGSCVTTGNADSAV